MEHLELELQVCVSLNMELGTIPKSLGKSVRVLNWLTIFPALWDFFSFTISLFFVKKKFQVVYLKYFSYSIFQSYFSSPNSSHITTLPLSTQIGVPFFFKHIMPNLYWLSSWTRGLLLEHGQLTRGYALKVPLFLSQQRSVVHTPSARSGTLCLPSLSVLESGPTWAQAGLVHAVTGAVSTYRQLHCCVRQILFLWTCTPPLALTHFLSPPLKCSPSRRRGRHEVDDLLRAE